MPKNKTHSGSSKRFRLTGSGRLLHRRANRNHLFENKPSRRTRRLWNPAELSPADRKKIRRLLGE